VTYLHELVVLAGLAAVASKKTGPLPDPAAYSPAFGMKPGLGPLLSALTTSDDDDHQLLCPQCASFLAGTARDQLWCLAVGANSPPGAWDDSVAAIPSPDVAQLLADNDELRTSLAWARGNYAHSPSPLATALGLEDDDYRLSQAGMDLSLKLWRYLAWHATWASEATFSPFQLAWGSSAALQWWSHTDIREHTAWLEAGEAAVLVLVEPGEFAYGIPPLAVFPQRTEAIALAARLLQSPGFAVGSKTGDRLARLTLMLQGPGGGGRALAVALASWLPGTDQLGVLADPSAGAQSAADFLATGTGLLEDKGSTPVSARDIEASLVASLAGVSVAHRPPLGNVEGIPAPLQRRQSLSLLESTLAGFQESVIDIIDTLDVAESNGWRPPVIALDADAEPWARVYTVTEMRGESEAAYSSRDVVAALDKALVWSGKHLPADQVVSAARDILEIALEYGTALARAWEDESVFVKSWVSSVIHRLLYTGLWLVSSLVPARDQAGAVADLISASLDQPALGLTDKPLEAVSEVGALLQSLGTAQLRDIAAYVLPPIVVSTLVSHTGTMGDRLDVLARTLQAADVEAGRFLADLVRAVRALASVSWTVNSMPPACQYEMGMVATMAVAAVLKQDDNRTLPLLLAAPAPSPQAQVTVHGLPPIVAVLEDYTDEAVLYRELLRAVTEADRSLVLPAADATSVFPADIQASAVLQFGADQTTVPDSVLMDVLGSEPLKLQVFRDLVALPLGSRLAAQQPRSLDPGFAQWETLVRAVSKDTRHISMRCGGQLWSELVEAVLQTEQWPFAAFLLADRPLGQSAGEPTRAPDDEFLEGVASGSSAARGVARVPATVPYVTVSAAQAGIVGGSGVPDSMVLDTFASGSRAPPASVPGPVPAPGLVPAPATPSLLGPGPGPGTPGGTAAAVPRPGMPAVTVSTATAPGPGPGDTVTGPGPGPGVAVTGPGLGPGEVDTAASVPRPGMPAVTVPAATVPGPGDTVTGPGLGPGVAGAGPGLGPGEVDTAASVSRPGMRTVPAPAATVPGPGDTADTVGVPRPVTPPAEDKIPLKPTHARRKRSNRFDRLEERLFRLYLRKNRKVVRLKNDIVAKLLAAAANTPPGETPSSPEAVEAVAPLDEEEEGPSTAELIAFVRELRETIESEQPSEAAVPPGLTPEAESEQPSQVALPLGLTPEEDAIVAEILATIGNQERGKPATPKREEDTAVVEEKEDPVLPVFPDSSRKAWRLVLRPSLELDEVKYERPPLSERAGASAYPWFYQLLKGLHVGIRQEGDAGNVAMNTFAGIFINMAGRIPGMPLPRELLQVVVDLTARPLELKTDVVSPLVAGLDVLAVITTAAHRISLRADDVRNLPLSAAAVVMRNPGEAEPDGVAMWGSTGDPILDDLIRGLLDSVAKPGTDGPHNLDVIRAVALSVAAARPDMGSAVLSFLGLAEHFASETVVTWATQDTRFAEPVKLLVTRYTLLLHPSRLNLRVLELPDYRRAKLLPGPLLRRLVLSESVSNPTLQTLPYNLDSARGRRQDFLYLTPELLEGVPEVQGDHVVQSLVRRSLVTALRNLSASSELYISKSHFMLTTVPQVHMWAQDQLSQFEKFTVLLDLVWDATTEVVPPTSGDVLRCPYLAALLALGPGYLSLAPGSSRYEKGTVKVRVGRALRFIQTLYISTLPKEDRPPARTFQDPDKQAVDSEPRARYSRMAGLGRGRRNAEVLEQRKALLLERIEVALASQTTVDVDALMVELSELEREQAEEEAQMDADMAVLDGLERRSPTLPPDTVVMAAGNESAGTAFLAYPLSDEDKELDLIVAGQGQVVAELGTIAEIAQFLALDPGHVSTLPPDSASLRWYRAHTQRALHRRLFYAVLTSVEGSDSNVDDAAWSVLVSPASPESWITALAEGCVLLRAVASGAGQLDTLPDLSLWGGNEETDRDELRVDADLPLRIFFQADFMTAESRSRLWSVVKAGLVPLLYQVADQRGILSVRYIALALRDPVLPPDQWAVLDTVAASKYAKGLQVLVDAAQFAAVEDLQSTRARVMVAEDDDDDDDNDFLFTAAGVDASWFPPVVAAGDEDWTQLLQIELPLFVYQEDDITPDNLREQLTLIRDLMMSLLQGQLGSGDYIERLRALPPDMHDYAAPLLGWMEEWVVHVSTALDALEGLRDRIDSELEMGDGITVEPEDRQAIYSWSLSVATVGISELRIAEWLMEQVTRVYQERGIEDDRLFRAAGASTAQLPPIVAPGDEDWTTPFHVDLQQFVVQEDAITPGSLGEQVTVIGDLILDLFKGLGGGGYYLARLSELPPDMHIFAAPLVGWMEKWVSLLAAVIPVLEGLRDQIGAELAENNANVDDASRSVFYARSLEIATMSVGDLRLANWLMEQIIDFYAPNVSGRPELAADAGDSLVLAVGAYFELPPLVLPGTPDWTLVPSIEMEDYIRAADAITVQSMTDQRTLVGELGTALAHDRSGGMLYVERLRALPPHAADTIAPLLAWMSEWEEAMDDAIGSAESLYDLLDRHLAMAPPGGTLTPSDRQLVHEISVSDGLALYVRIGRANNISSKLRDYYFPNRPGPPDPGGHPTDFNTGDPPPLPMAAGTEERQTRGNLLPLSSPAAVLLWNVLVQHTSDIAFQTARDAYTARHGPPPEGFSPVELVMMGLGALGDPLVEVTSGGQRALAAQAHVGSLANTLPKGAHEAFEALLWGLTTALQNAGSLRVDMPMSRLAGDPGVRKFVSSVVGGSSQVRGLPEAAVLVNMLHNTEQRLPATTKEYVVAVRGNLPESTDWQREILEAVSSRGLAIVTRILLAGYVASATELGDQLKAVFVEPGLRVYPGPGYNPTTELAALRGIVAALVHMTTGDASQEFEARAQGPVGAIAALATALRFASIARVPVATIAMATGAPHTDEASLTSRPDEVAVDVLRFLESKAVKLEFADRDRARDPLLAILYTSVMAGAARLLVGSWVLGYSLDDPEWRPGESEDFVGARDITSLPLRYEWRGAVDRALLQLWSTSLPGGSPSAPTSPTWLDARVYALKRQSLRARVGPDSIVSGVLSVRAVLMAALTTLLPVPWEDDLSPVIVEELGLLSASDTQQVVTARALARTFAAAKERGFLPDPEFGLSEVFLLADSVVAESGDRDVVRLPGGASKKKKKAPSALHADTVLVAAHTIARTDEADQIWNAVYNYTVLDVVREQPALTAAEAQQLGLPTEYISILPSGDIFSDQAPVFATLDATNPVGLWSASMRHAPDRTTLVADPELLGPGTIAVVRRFLSEKGEIDEWQLYAGVFGKYAGGSIRYGPRGRLSLLDYAFYYAYGDAFGGWTPSGFDPATAAETSHRQTLLDGLGLRRHGVGAVTTGEPGGVHLSLAAGDEEGGGGGTATEEAPVDSTVVWDAFMGRVALHDSSTPKQWSDRTKAAAITAALYSGRPGGLRTAAALLDAQPPLCTCTDLAATAPALAAVLEWSVAHAGQLAPSLVRATVRWTLTHLVDNSNAPLLVRTLFEAGRGHRRDAAVAGAVTELLHDVRTRLRFGQVAGPWTTALASGSSWDTCPVLGTLPSVDALEAAGISVDSQPRELHAWYTQSLAILAATKPGVASLQIRLALQQGDSRRIQELGQSGATARALVLAALFTEPGLTDRAVDDGVRVLTEDAESPPEPSSALVTELRRDALLVHLQPAAATAGWMRHMQRVVSHSSVAAAVSQSVIGDGVLRPLSGTQAPVSHRTFPWYVAVADASQDISPGVQEAVLRLAHELHRSFEEKEDPARMQQVVKEGLGTALELAARPIESAFVADITDSAHAVLVYPALREDSTPEVQAALLSRLLGTSSEQESPAAVLVATLNRGPRALSSMWRPTGGSLVCRLLLAALRASWHSPLHLETLTGVVRPLAASSVQRASDLLRCLTVRPASATSYPAKYVAALQRLASAVVTGLQESGACPADLGPERMTARLGPDMLEMVDPRLLSSEAVLLLQTLYEAHGHPVPPDVATAARRAEDDMPVCGLALQTACGKEP